MQSNWTDRYGRNHDYLRISVTDRCNLRCVYCMPAEGMKFEPEDRLLSFDEIIEFVRVAARMGISRLRLTGGEPLVRKHLYVLIRRLAEIPGIQDIALTTNGMLLAKQARVLKEAGLTRVNISLDSLRPDRFRQITRGGEVSRVLDGIRSSCEAGLSPVKLNVLLMKGRNDDEIADFLRMTIDHPVEIRFIEYMPIGTRNEEWREGYIPLQVVKERALQAGYDFTGTDKGIGSGPAEYYRIQGAAGTFGLIIRSASIFVKLATGLD